MTPLGKEFRKWRIDREMLLGTMADALGISPSYLSQIEKGHKPSPPGLVEKAATVLKLDDTQTEALRRAFIASQTQFTVEVPNVEDRQVAHQFVTEFARLTPDQKLAIQRLLGS